MAVKRPTLSGEILEGLSKVLGDTSNGLSNNEITKYLKEVDLPNVFTEGTKWKRIYNAFVTYQHNKNISNNILRFINKSLHPARFVGRNQQYEDTRIELNKRLCFAGLELSESGKFREIESIFTITDAEYRASRFRKKLEQRETHYRIYEFCNAELLNENYFHSVFEAVKSVFEVIRMKSGLSVDGNLLIEQAFSINNPLIQINSLSNETEISEHRGFVNLLKGVTGMFRNTTAHAPKITWQMSEIDALDILTTLSLIHRKLD
ncbi:MAG: TIGR02391 family protein [Chryseobacterium sp. SCN 40-13]|nr:MAG: TIGR02391 family protein [Chryseobacterium sp. SCN 40-13]